MCENSTAGQTAALRREARRRKILENSADRLKLIEGINSSSSESYLKPEPRNFEPVVSTKYVSEEPEISSKFNEIFKENNELRKISEFLAEDKEVEEEEEENDEVESTAEVVEIKQVPLIKFFVEKKLHYVILALLVDFLLFIDAGFLFYENVFCPFYTLKLVEIISRKGIKKESQLVLFLFLARIPESLQKYIKFILSLVTTIFSDLFLYLFTFIVGTKIFNIQKKIE